MVWSKPPAVVTNRDSALLHEIALSVRREWSWPYEAGLVGDDDELGAVTGVELGDGVWR